MKKSPLLTAAFSLGLCLGPMAPALPLHATDFSSQLIIKAVNPGYATDSNANAGELIELQNLSPDSLLLTGFSLYYTNSSGNRSNLIEFPEGSMISGEASILLRLASSPEATRADLLYTKTLAMAAGPLELAYLDTIVDSVCWNGNEGCLSKFSKDSPTTIVRNTSTNTYTHQSNYEPEWDSTGYTAPALADTEEAPSPQCRGLQFTEILSYYADDKSEQFIVFFNATDESISLAGCTISYKNKLYSLVGTVQPGDYLIRAPTDFTLTKNPTSSNAVTLLDVNGDILDILEYPHGQKKSASYALFGYDDSGQAIWRITYRPTPASANIYQEYRTCPAGKVINEATGNCVKSATLAPIKDCPAGKYRNPATGRCKSLEDDTSPVPCKAGYERNPETNRCRKIKANTGASYALVPETGATSQTFIAFWAIAALVLLGLIYLAFQFRRELKAFIARLFHRKE